MSKMTVLDASALLALLNEEPGYQKVETVLSSAVMSSVNIAETIAVLTEIGISQGEAEQLTLGIIEHIIPFNTEQACIAASLRKYTKPYGLSLGDRACLSLAQMRKLPVITADKIWQKIHIADVKIHLIR